MRFCGHSVGVSDGVIAEGKKHLLRPSRESRLEKKEGRGAQRSPRAAVDCCSSENFSTCNMLLPLANITVQQLPGGKNTHTQTHALMFLVMIYTQKHSIPTAHIAN